MRIDITLPPQIEDTIRTMIDNVEDTAREAVLVELYRREVLTKFELAEALGIDRFEADRLLIERGVYEGSVTLEDLAGDRDTLDRVLG